MRIAKKFVLIKPFKGLPTKSDVVLMEEALPPLKPDDFLAKALYISIDPLQRVTPHKIGSTVMGFQIAEIIESKNLKYPVGMKIIGLFGWRTYTIANGKGEWIGFPQCYPIPNIKNVPLSSFLGTIGITGFCAYFGLLKICKPQPGETVVVSAAAGATGYVAGQIAKIKNCKVIGITGSEQKGKYLINELNFDNYVNYKSPNFELELRKAAPNGIDCYFDNVGGQVASVVISQMKKFGRVACCGSISNYNTKEYEKVSPIITTEFITKGTKMEGFIVSQWFDQFQEAGEIMANWYTEGKLEIKETIVEGFESCIQTFIEMFKGQNIGKAIIKC